ncbi:MAG: protein arginine kinase [Ruminococcaceae bacterium]|nr:protein arginine kinase [Oscillospiraceae bacterium]
MNKWYKESGYLDDIVLSTRIRLARNIKNIPFPSKLKSEDAKKVIEKTQNAVENFNYKLNKIDLASLSGIERQSLLEEHQISSAMLSGSENQAFFLSEDNKVGIMVNEEDHLRIQCIYAGYETDKAFDLINKVDDYLSENLEYAFDENYGYLTSCLTNLGTGIRVSYMVHIPALCMSGLSDKIFSVIGKLGIAVRGIYGEGSKSQGHVFQISNQITLGVDESEIIKKLKDAIDNIILQERELRNKLFKENRIVIEDKIMRSYAVMKYAKIISSKELLDALSFVRLGISENIIEGIDSKLINTLLIETRPAHIMCIEKEELDAHMRDIKRAQIVNSILEGKEE